MLPEQKEFSLGKLVSNLGIPFSIRHRAFGDAQATLKLFELLIEKDIKKNIIKQHIKILNNNKASKRFLKIIEKLPSEMGIYYILDAHKKIIYIGKSKNIKQSVSQYLTSSNKKSLIIQNKISQASFSLTGGQLVTLLKQQIEIKINSPVLNTSSKYRIYPIGVRVDDKETYHRIIIEQVKKNFKYLTVFKNKIDAEKTIQILAEKFEIQLNDLNFSIKEKESPKKYNYKVKKLSKSFSYPFPNFLIIENGRKHGEFTFILIKNNQFRGYGYFELNHQIKTMSQINSRLISMKENNDTKKLIYSFLLKKKYIKLINL